MWMAARRSLNTAASSSQASRRANADGRFVVLEAAHGTFKGGVNYNGTLANKGVGIARSMTSRERFQLKCRRHSLL